jgi:hypothetical protein
MALYWSRLMVDMPWEASNVFDARAPSWQPLSSMTTGFSSVKQQDVTQLLQQQDTSL